MPLPELKINGNRLFTPAVLLFVLFFTFQLSTQEFKDTYNNYSILLAAGIMVFALKSFVMTFANLEKTLDTKKWVLMMFNLVLYVAESWLAWLAVKELTIDSYPKFTIEMVIIASLCFYLQLLSVNLKGMLWVCIISFVLYCIIFALLLTSGFNSFIGNSQLLIIFQQLTGYLTLGIEVVSLALVSRAFINKGLIVKS